MRKTLWTIERTAGAIGGASSASSAATPLEVYRKKINDGNDPVEFPSLFRVSWLNSPLTHLSLQASQKRKMSRLHSAAAEAESLTPDSFAQCDTKGHDNEYFLCRENDRHYFCECRY